jgi:transmembrane sensor
MVNVSIIARLIHKKVHGTLTIREKENLEAWISEHPQYRGSIDKYATSEFIESQMKVFWEINPMAIRQRLGIFPRSRGASIVRLMKQRPAAVLIFAVIGLVLWALMGSSKPEFSAYRPAGLHQLLAMDGNIFRPTLTFGDDLPVYADSAQEGLFRRMGLWRLIQQGGTQLALWPENEPHVPRQLPDSILINLGIPAGKSWKLLLPDRSMVELHPGSSLSFHLFPYDTAARYRQVALRGEARVHASCDSHVPFIVETQRGEIKVLGTSFIIRDYDNEDSMKVIQLSGKTLVTNGKFEVLLTKNGQTATFDKYSKAGQVSDGAPFRDSVYLPSDIFDFSHETLPTAMEEVRKWYGKSKISFGKGVDTTTVGKLSEGTITKDLPLRILLDMLSTDDMKFVIRDQTILVSK